MVRGFRTEVLPLSVLFPVTVPSRNKVRTDTAGLRCPRSLPLRVFEVSLDFVTVRDLILFLTARGDQLTIDTLHQVVKCHPNLRDSVVEAVVVPQLECVNKSQPCIKQELRDSNTGRFSRRTACIRLPHHNRFTKIYHKVRLQHNSTAETSGTVILANVHASVAPQFGWYNVTCSNHVRIV